MDAQITRLLITILLACGTTVAQQAPPANPSNSEAQLASVVQELQRQIARLETSVEELRGEASRYREETTELKRRLELISNAEARSELPPAAAETAATNQEPDQTSGRSASAKLSKLEEQYERAKNRPTDNAHVRELTLRSLKKLINQLIEEIVRYESQVDLQAKAQ